MRSATQKLIVRLLGILAFTWLAALSSAALKSAVSPPSANGKPIPVRARLFIEEIDDVDEGNETFTIDGYLDLSWSDPRLAFEPDRAGGSIKTYLGDGAKLELEQIWWPAIDIVNANKKPELDNEELMVASNGAVTYREKVRCSLKTPFAMHRFPFDTQSLKIHLESFANDAKVLVFATDAKAIDMSPDLRLAGWKIRRVEEAVCTYQDMHDRAPFSELDAVVTVERTPGFFVVKFLIPLVVVMLLISGVLWMPSEQIKDRVSATLTGMLTSAGYGFTITKYLPANVYDTYLDAVVLLSLCYSSALMIENVVTFRLHVAGQVKKSARLDFWCRFIFPFGFLAILCVLAKTYGIL